MNLSLLLPRTNRTTLYKTDFQTLLVSHLSIKTLILLVWNSCTPYNSILHRPLHIFDNQSKKLKEFSREQPELFHAPISHLCYHERTDRYNWNYHHYNNVGKGAILDQFLTPPNSTTLRDYSRIKQIKSHVGFNFYSEQWSMIKSHCPTYCWLIISHLLNEFKIHCRKVMHSVATSN